MPPAPILRTVLRLVAVIVGTTLVLAGCTASGEPGQHHVGSAADGQAGAGSAAGEQRDATTTPHPPELATPLPAASGPERDPRLRADLTRYCTAHASALDAIEEELVDIVDQTDETSHSDAVTVLLVALEAVTSAIVSEFGAHDAPHPDVRALIDAAEATATSAREALAAGHEVRQAYLDDELRSASYLEPLVDDAGLYEAVTDLAACSELPLGAVMAELRHRERFRY